MHCIQGPGWSCVVWRLDVYLFIDVCIDMFIYVCISFYLSAARKSLEFVCEQLKAQDGLAWVDPEQVRIERDRECVCMCSRARESAIKRERENENEKERECACVCVRAEKGRGWAGLDGSGSKYYIDCIRIYICICTCIRTYLRTCI